MNHDFSHCTGEGCAIKQFCHRYRAHKQLHAGQNDLIAYTDPEECLKHNKFLFMKEK